MAISVFFIFDQLLVARSRNICYILSIYHSCLDVGARYHHFYTVNTRFQIFVCRRLY